MPVNDRNPTELESVEQFRKQALIDAGYPQEEAWLLAQRHDIDLHVACDMLASNCSVKTALRILL